jgi:type II secretory pathway component PulF
MMGKRHYESIFLILWNLYSHFKAGININLSLKIIEDILDNKKYKSSIKVIREKLKGGSTLSYAFSMYRQLYPEFMLDMIKIGEESGNIETVLFKLSQHYKKIAKLRKKIRGIMIYPLFLLAMTFFTIIAFFTFILPTFSKLYDGLDAKVSGLTAQLIFLSKDMEAHKFFWQITILCIFAIIVSSIIVIYQLIKYLNIIPSVKIINKYFELNLIYILGLIISSGLSFYSSFSVLERSLSSRILKSYIKTINNYINMGLPISEGINKISGISMLTKVFLISGEQSGTLQENIEILIELVENDFNNHIDKLVGYIQPMVMMFLGIIIGGMVLMVFIPMYSYMNYV